ncbi:MarR family winged helix-turn-helix transcriptional regulator [Nocardioides sp.]|uniref:MarR family winged helix-turn-helix transcriptional regulator n=1 Tax=Nocardioides sp. TaxID=35761 RepID=UPI0027268291|nr:MarR family transcriptional regulator [Nocardioides sp.]MDO9457516.1 MarR family transcriptional regulator [Nocardioides sp.]
MTSDSPWLSADQQQAWRRWIALLTALPATLNRELQDTEGLSFSDYDVLVALTETEGGRLRVGDLAAAVAWERSRLSHHLRRMEKRGLVEREECEDDGRGSWVVVSEAGVASMERAAPSHARLVRELVFDDLTDAELAVLDKVLDGVLTKVRANGG